MSDTKVVILAGGFGTRLSEETDLKPKPMIDIGGMPIIWHIMKIYSSYGFKDFIICLGYKGYLIKEYFANYYLHTSDVTFDFTQNEPIRKIHKANSEPWKITLVDTGENSMTGGRIKKIQNYVGDNTFMLTYGDGLSNVDIGQLFKFHKKQKRKATVTAVMPPGRFGALEISGGHSVSQFMEKPTGDGNFINGGFFVLEPDIFDLIQGSSDVWEEGPLKALAKEDQLSAFVHKGFWQPMDTLREKNLLENLWAKGNAPWKLWD
jgi:glucose-1-phosphate cytidylyltransferase